MLTGSSTDLKIDHSHKTTNSQELGAEVKGGWGSGDSGNGGGQGGGGGGSAGPNLSASLTTKFNWSDERVDSTGVGVGSTGQTRTATTTTISQLYSLLESYHLGSNVMSFLMLPRPHVLPSTSLHTFVPGLRALDGIQEFFLVVAAPPESYGLRIEARVDTGHFSTTDGASAPPPPVVTIPTVFTERPVEMPDEQVIQWTNSSDYFDIRVRVFPTDLWGGGEPTRNSFIYLVDVPPPSAGLGDLIIDTTRGDPGHPGISLIDDRSPSATQGRLQNNLYLAISETEVRIEIDVTTSVGQGLPDIDMTYRVYTRPRTSNDSERTDVVVVARGLCVEFEDIDENGCLQGAITHDSPPLEYSDRAVPHASSGGGSGASGGMSRTIGSSSSGGGGPLGGMSGSYGLALDLLHGMKRCLAGTQRKQAGREAAQSLGDSDFVVLQLTSNLDPHVGGRRISTLKGKNTPAGLRGRTVAQVLSEPAAALARVTSQPESRIRAFRRQILARVLAIDPAAQPTLSKPRRSASGPRSRAR